MPSQPIICAVCGTLHKVGERHGCAPRAIVKCQHNEPAGSCAVCDPASAELSGDEFRAKAGKKFDGGKAPIASLFMRYFPRAVQAVANVSEYGARKYTPEGWKTVPDGIARYGDAMARHEIKQFIEGPYDDGDSGLSHAAQVAWNAMARLELALAAGKIEDRRGNDIGSDGKPVLGTARKA